MSKPRPLNVEFTKEERDVLEQLAKEGDTSLRNVLRQSLRLYQLVKRKAEQGWEIDFINSKGERHGQLMARAMLGLGPLP